MIETEIMTVRERTIYKESNTKEGGQQYEKLILCKDS
jgi:hypothetical protein